MICPLAMCESLTWYRYSTADFHQQTKKQVGTPSLGDSPSFYHNCCRQASEGETKMDGFADLHIIVSWTKETCVCNGWKQKRWFCRFAQILHQKQEAKIHVVAEMRCRKAGDRLITMMVMMMMMVMVMVTMIKMAMTMMRAIWVRWGKAVSGRTNRSISWHSSYLSQTPQTTVR